MLEKLPNTPNNESQDANVRRVYIAELRDEIIFRANNLYNAILSSGYLPHGSDTPLLSGDDEHPWIGLAP